MSAPLPEDLPEVDRLRAEVEQLRADLRATERECEILHGLCRSRARIPNVPFERIQIGSRERMSMLEHAVEVLEDFTREVASWDCYDYDCAANNKCQRCRAREALETVRAWRYGGSITLPSRRFEGAMHYRTLNGWQPRETKIHAAWVRHMELWGPDRTLGRILTDRSPGQSDDIRDWPTPRDWYVATSVVQWLVTNVGSSILEAADWRYTQWNEDRAAIEAKEALERRS